MHDCPSCRMRLVKHRLSRRVYWGCPQCDGRAVGMGLFRKHVDGEAVASLWRQISLSQVGHRQCPFCRKRMKVAFAPNVPHNMQLDACTYCRHIWFDAGELAPLAPELQLKEFKNAKKMNFGRDDAKNPSEQQSEESGFALIASPPEAWQWVPALLGFPVEHRRRNFTNLPWVTWITALIVLAVSIMSFGSMDDQIHRYGFYPHSPFRNGGLTLISSFFLHGGWLHLIGNLYFFLVFGDDVEDFLGSWRYVLLLILATMAGNLTVGHLMPLQTTPHIGASGGVFGVIIFYMLKFPKARLSFLPIPLLWAIGLLRVPAWAALLWFMGVQVVGAYQQMAGFGHISFLSHLGGAIVGAVFWVLFGLKRE